MSINERLDALMEAQGVQSKDLPMPVKVGNKRNVCAGGNGFLGQRFPVTLYASSWAWFLREENIEALVSFLEDNQNELSWEK